MDHSRMLVCSIESGNIVPGELEDVAEGEKQCHEHEHGYDEEASADVNDRRLDRQSFAPRSRTRWTTPGRYGYTTRCIQL